MLETTLYLTQTINPCLKTIKTAAIAPARQQGICGPQARADRRRSQRVGGVSCSLKRWVFTFVNLWRSHVESIKKSIKHC